MEKGKQVVFENIAHVEKRILDACNRAGRKREEVTLIVVSKTKPIEMLSYVYEKGIREFGENKVQELVAKYEEMPEDVNWHMIGHLQRNKVKSVIDKACLIHSVDSYRLAKQIDNEASKINKIVNVLIEVNIAEEESKFGIKPSELDDLMRLMPQLKNIKIKVLMTIAPFVKSPEDNRIHFRNLKQLSVDIKSKNIDNVSMSTLSMGMTNDYEVAIEEGATQIRVGTGIFGERIYR